MDTQRKNRRNRPPEIESLEAMTLMSTLPGLGFHHAPAEVSAAAVSTNVNFNASTKGTFYTTKANPDTGTDYHVVTHGKTASGATISVSGDLVTPGFVQQGR